MNEKSERKKKLSDVDLSIKIDNFEVITNLNNNHIKSSPKHWQINEM